MNKKEFMCFVNSLPLCELIKLKNEVDKSQYPFQYDLINNKIQHFNSNIIPVFSSSKFVYLFNLIPLIAGVFLFLSGFLNVLFPHLIKFMEARNLPNEINNTILITLGLMFLLRYMSTTRKLLNVSIYDDYVQIKQYNGKQKVILWNQISSVNEVWSFQSPIYKMKIKNTTDSILLSLPVNEKNKMKNGFFNDSNGFIEYSLNKIYEMKNIIENK